MIQPPTLIVGKEEQFVLQNWPTDGASKDVPAQLGLGQSAVWSFPSSQKTVLPGVGVEFIVAEKFKNIAMEAVGPGF